MPGTSPPFSEMFTHLQFPCPWMPEHQVMPGGFLVLPGQGDGLGAHIPPHHQHLGWVPSVTCHCPVGDGSSLSAPESSPTPPLPQLGSRRKALLLLTLELALKGRELCRNQDTNHAGMSQLAPQRVACSCLPQARRGPAEIQPHGPEPLLGLLPILL